MASTTTLSNVYIHGCGKSAVEGKGGFLDRATLAHLGERRRHRHRWPAGFSITNSFIVHNGNEREHARRRVHRLDRQRHEPRSSSTPSRTTRPSRCRSRRWRHVSGLGDAAPCTEQPHRREHAEQHVSVRLRADRSSPTNPSALRVLEHDRRTVRLSHRRHELGPRHVDRTVDRRRGLRGQFRPLGPAKDVGADEFKP